MNGIAPTLASSHQDRIRPRGHRRQSRGPRSPGRSLSPRRNRPLFGNAATESWNQNCRSMVT